MGQRVVLYGASGHTGRFVVDELRERGFEVVLSGRDGGRLRALGAGEVRAARVDDPAALDRALAGADAVINCAGPFAVTAAPLVEAALRAGIPYLDVAAEIEANLDTFRLFDDRARAAGVPVLPAVAFYGGLADLLVTAAVGGWPAADEVHVAYGLSGWHPTAGTREAGAVSARRRDGRRVRYTGGRLQYHDEGLPELRWEFPAPLGGREVLGGFTMAEVVTLPRHLAVPEIRSYMTVEAARELGAPGTPSPAAADDRGRSGQTFLVDVLVRRGGEEQRATARGRDIYAVSAPLVVEAASRVLSGRTGATGTVTPGEAFDARDFLAALAPHVTTGIGVAGSCHDVPRARSRRDDHAPRRRVMSHPRLPHPEPGEVLLVGTCYQNGAALWGDLLDELGGRRDGDVIVLGETGVRLRPVEDPEWDFLPGGNVPALVSAGSPAPPVAVLADIPVVHGGDGPLLVDLAATPGRGVRVPPERLGEVLAGLVGGGLAFDELVRDMDVCGMYQGDAGRPAFPAPAAPPRRSFPPLPAATEALLVRTSFDDEAGWRALLDELGGTDGDGRVGAALDPDGIDPERYPLTALVVDDRAFEGLLPGEVPALVPPPERPFTAVVPLVALADARTFTEPGRPLTAVDLYDTPGQPAVLPCRMIGSMSVNLEISNMDFFEFVPREGVEPWWGSS